MRPPSGAAPRTGAGTMRREDTPVNHNNNLPGLHELVAAYRQLAGLLARMVEHARARHWAALPALDAQCADLLARVRALGEHGVSTLDRARIVVLAHRIRTAQEELHGLVRPQFVQLVERVQQLHAAPRFVGVRGA